LAEKDGKKRRERLQSKKPFLWGELRAQIKASKKKREKRSRAKKGNSRAAPPQGTGAQKKSLNGQGIDSKDAVTFQVDSR